MEEAVAEVHHRVVEVEEARLLDADHQDVDPHHQEGKWAYDSNSYKL